MAAPSLTKLAYHTLQQSKNLAGLAHKGISTRMMEIFSPDSPKLEFDVDPTLLNKLRESMIELENLDWNEAEMGFYPKKQLFDSPWLEWASKYPLVWLDMPSTWERRKKNDTRDMPKKINKDSYPNYYLQPFL